MLKDKKPTPTCRPFSRVSHFTIYFQGLHSSKSRPCSHRVNLSMCLQGARWAQALLTWSVMPFPIFWPSHLKLACFVFLVGSWRPDSKSAKLSSTWGHDTGSLEMGRRCSLGCATGGDKYGNAGLSSDFNSNDVLYTAKSQKLLVFFPQIILDFSKAMSKKQILKATTYHRALPWP